MYVLCGPDFSLPPKGVGGIDWVEDTDWCEDTSRYSTKPQKTTQSFKTLCKNIEYNNISEILNESSNTY